MKLLADAVFVTTDELVEFGIPYGSITNGLWRNRQKIGRANAWRHCSFVEGIHIQYSTIPKNTRTRYNLPREAEMRDLCIEQQRKREATEQALKQEFEKLVTKQQA